LTEHGDRLALPGAGPGTAVGWSGTPAEPALAANTVLAGALGAGAVDSTSSAVFRVGCEVRAFAEAAAFVFLADHRALVRLAAIEFGAGAVAAGRGAGRAFVAAAIAMGGIRLDVSARATFTAEVAKRAASVATAPAVLRAAVAAAADIRKRTVAAAVPAVFAVPSGVDAAASATELAGGAGFAARAAICRVIPDIDRGAVAAGKPLRHHDAACAAIAG
jgi:hypothetical protein